MYHSFTIKTGVTHMPLMKRFSKRLNLNISPKTYEVIRKVANRENRKTGSMAREVLEKWAKKERP